VQGDLPIGAGVSSSAALEVSFFLAWQHLGGYRHERLQVARMAQRVENEYLGVQSGIQDPFASLLGRADHGLFLDCRQLDWRAIPLPAGYAVLMADSGIRRRLSEGGLNERRDECIEALRALRELGLDLCSLRDLSIEDLDAASGEIAAGLLRRARHVVEECERVQSGAKALAAGRMSDFGRLMQASHCSSRDLYEVSTPELDTLAETAWSVAGCVGARLSGAGSGGCVVALCEEASMSRLKEALLSAFAARFGRRPEVFECRLGDGAELLEPPGAQGASACASSASDSA